MLFRLPSTEPVTCHKHGYGSSQSINGLPRELQRTVPLSRYKESPVKHNAKVSRAAEFVCTLYRCLTDKTTTDRVSTELINCKRLGRNLICGAFGQTEHNVHLGAAVLQCLIRLQRGQCPDQALTVFALQC